MKTGDTLRVLVDLINSLIMANFSLRILQAYEIFFTFDVAILYE